MTRNETFWTVEKCILLNHLIIGQEAKSGWEAVLVNKKERINITSKRLMMRVVDIFD